MAKLPKAPLRKFFDDTEIKHLRVTGKAMYGFRDDVEAYADALARTSTKAAIHAGRKTVKVEDLELVQEIFTIFVLIQTGVIKNVKKGLEELEK